MANINISVSVAPSVEEKKVSPFKLCRRKFQYDEFIMEEMSRLATLVIGQYMIQCLNVVHGGSCSGEALCRPHASTTDPLRVPNGDAHFMPSMCINHFKELLSFAAIKVMNVQDLPLFMAMLLPKERGGKGLKCVLETCTPLRTFGYSEVVLSAHSDLKWVASASGLRVCIKTADQQTVLGADMRVARAIRQHFKPGGHISRVCALRVNDAFRAALSKVEFKEMQEWMASTPDGEKMEKTKKDERREERCLSNCPLYIHQKLLDECWNTQPPSAAGFYCPLFDENTKDFPSPQSPPNRARREVDPLNARNRSGGKEKGCKCESGTGVDRKCSDAERKRPNEANSRKESNAKGKYGESDTSGGSDNSSGGQTPAARWADQLQSLQLQPHSSDSSTFHSSPAARYTCRDCGDVTRCWWLSSAFYTIVEGEQSCKYSGTHHERCGQLHSSQRESLLTGSVERVAMTSGALRDLMEQMLLTHTHCLPAITTRETRLALDHLIAGFGGGDIVKPLFADIISAASLRAHLLIVVQDVFVVLAALYTHSYPQLRNRPLSVSVNVRETSNQLSQRMCVRLGEAGGVVQALSLLDADYKK